MESLRLIEVRSRKDLRRWVRVPHRLYRRDPHYVPQLVADEISFFAKDNPAFEVADCRLILACRGYREVGRIACIVHSGEERKLGYKRGRFGWFECAEDPQAASALLGEGEKWLRQKGCVEATGPHGFTDLDPEGLLVEGFDETPTVSGSYNFRYYADYLSNAGFEKQVDYVEHRLKLPDQVPEIFTKARQRIESKSEFKIFACRSRAEVLQYADSFWDALEASFRHLYGVTPLTDKQRQFYSKRHLSYLDPEFVHLAIDSENSVVGFFVGMPNLSQAFRNAGGALFPFGLFHVLRGLKTSRTVDFLLAGVRPNYPTQSLLSALSLSMYDSCKRRGIRYVETNRELETNTSVTGIWKKFGARMHRRSRIYRKAL